MRYWRDCGPRQKDDNANQQDWQPFDGKDHEFDDGEDSDDYDGGFRIPVKTSDMFISWL